MRYVHAVLMLTAASSAAVFFACGTSATPSPASSVVAVVDSGASTDAASSGAHPPAAPDAGGSPPDAGSFDASGEICGHLVGPDLPGGCTSSCSDAGGAKSCQTNGCYRGDWCDTDALQCGPAPNGGQCGGDGPGVPYDGGPAPTGTVGLDGGLTSRLFFSVVGDTRPATPDDTAHYPTPIIAQIFADIEALSPRPTFAVSTGDYMFATATGSEGAAQLDLYVAARAKYSGIVFPTMGNHECTGATKSNCGTGNANGITNNYTAFLSTLLAPLGRSTPNYELDVSATDSSWTAKFLFVPGNAWDAGVAAWMTTAMSRPTTYTFIVRHEGVDAATAPGVTPSEAIMAKYPYTLALVGHDHIYSHSGAREVTIGNGGAPPTGASNYGYGIVSQRADGALAVDAIDYQTGLADSSFHFAVHPDGSAAPP